MKKFAPVLVVVGILIVGFLYFMNVKNKALLFSQATEKEWGNVNTAYQRRLDLIDNLVNTVKGAADFEKSTLTAVVEARAKATSGGVRKRFK
jgi:LemA protein